MAPQKVNYPSPPQHTVAVMDPEEVLPVGVSMAGPAMTPPPAKAPVLTLPPRAVKNTSAQVIAVEVELEDSRTPHAAYATDVEVQLTKSGVCFTPSAASATEPRHTFAKTPCAAATNALGFGMPQVSVNTTAALPPTAPNTPRAATEVPVAGWTGTITPSNAVTPRAAGQTGALPPTAPCTPTAAVTGWREPMCIDVDAWCGVEAPPTILGVHGTDVWQQDDVHGESLPGSDEDRSPTGIVDASGGNDSDVDSDTESSLATPHSLFGADDPVFTSMKLAGGMIFDDGPEDPPVLMSMKLVEPREKKP